MLIAIAGSQGSGKTTVLNHFANLGYRVIERKTSRSILEDWGVTLQQVNNDYELTTKFQQEILHRKLCDDRSGVEDPGIVFTERTFIDLLTYATITLGKDNTYSDWLNKYAQHCIDGQHIYTLVFYLTGGHFNIEHDGVRGSNKYYGKMVDATMAAFYNTYHPGGSYTLKTINQENHRIRVVEIAEIIQEYTGKYIKI